VECSVGIEVDGRYFWKKKICALLCSICMVVDEINCVGVPGEMDSTWLAPKTCAARELSLLVTDLLACWIQACAPLDTGLAFHASA
jgi:hypothetical protein